MLCTSPESLLLDYVNGKLELAESRIQNQLELDTSRNSSRIRRWFISGDVESQKISGILQSDGVFVSR
jgi:hypothetical protein